MQSIHSVFDGRMNRFGAASLRLQLDSGLESLHYNTLMAKREKKQIEEAPAAKEISPKALAAIVLAVLIAALAVAGYWAWGIVSHVEEFGQAADSFGYLQLAKDIRAGKSAWDDQKFIAGSDPGRDVITALYNSKLDVKTWEAAVAPAAYHFDARSQYVINQYPPGVGYLLAIFPAGKALASLYTIVFLLIGAAAIGVSVWTFRRVSKEENLAPLLPAVLLFLALHAALAVLGATVSYSVDFFILVSLPAVAFAVAAGKSKSWWAVLFAALSGAFAGYAVLMRVAAIFFLPAIALALFRRDKKAIAGVIAYAAGAFVCGILPLMLHQRALTDSMFGTTYSSIDVTPIELGVIGNNAAHYFAGDGSLLNWTLFAAITVFALGGVALNRAGSGIKLSPWWIAGAVAAFVIPTLYFLTHRVVTPYYQFPTLEMTTLILAGAAAMLRTQGPIPSPWNTLLVIGILLGTAIHLTVALMPPKDIFSGEKTRQRTLALVDEVKNPKSFVFAARYSGTLWWSHDVYAMDAMKGSPEARAIIWNAAKNSGAPAYVIDDRPDPEKFDDKKQFREPPQIAELRAIGGTATRLPKENNFEGAEIWRITW